ncbi:MAG: UvrD-helicase domain-containing protein [Verrucomicrobia bacterium]|nr:UvrD-helicase domain-containing protein [Verrucomicrobiota bacterium]
MIPLTESQRDAIAARGNVIVVAGAGTGKTRTLVERSLALVEEGRSLEDILMVTFTEAAATEMRSRIREALRAKTSLLRAKDNHGGPEGSRDSSCLLPSHHEPTPSPLPGGELETGAKREDPLLGGAGGGFRGSICETLSGNSHPAPLPSGEGESSPVRPPIVRSRDHLTRDDNFPLPEGEGQGEGKGGDRLPGGSSSADVGSEAEKLREHFEKQLALLDVAPISTLHSFCLRLVREHFYELGMDPEVTVLDETQTRPLIRQTFDAIFEGHYANETETAKAVQSLVRVQGHGADEGIRALVLRLHRYTQSLPNPEHWLLAQCTLFREPEPAQWRSWFLDAFLAWRNAWQPALESFTATLAVKLCRQALESVSAGGSFAEAAKTIRALRSADAAPENWPSGSKTTVRSQLKGFFADLEFLDSLLPAGGKDPLQEDWQFVRPPMLALIELVREFSAEFGRAKRALGGVDFADLEQFALRLLQEPGTGEPTPIARDWRERLEYIFVDEYQDINGAQDAILTALSRDGAQANRFLVGDVKQSIYRFRLANPSLFRGYEEKWRSGTAHARRISLADNFRSRGPMLDFVNSLFGSLLHPDIGGVDYEALNSGRIEEQRPLASGAEPEPDVEFHLIARGDDEATENEASDEDATGREDLADLRAAEREARLVALRLLELHRQGHEIWDQSEKKFRPAQWSDMAVLLRSPAGRAEAFAMEFHRVGVPLQAARRDFFQCLEVSDLLSLLKLIDNPLQDIPLLAVLRSPLVGLSVEELGEIRAHNREPSFWLTLKRFHREARRNGVEQAAASAWEKTDLFLRQFESWRELVRHTSLSNCLEAALAETHYDSLLLAGARGAQRLANVRRFVDLARQYDPYQRQGLFRFLRFIAAQEDSETDLEPASAPTENAVQLLSIHKSKGLEFPVVVVAGLGWRFNFRDLSEDVLLDEKYGLCPKVAPPEAEQRYPSLPHWLARQRQRGELLGEEMRLLYVALTRARDRLILTATTSSKGDPKWSVDVFRQGAPNSVSASLRRCGTDRVETEFGAPIKVTARASKAVEALPGLSRQEILSARCCLDWMQAWLPQVARETDWRSDRDGRCRLLRWTIYSETDSRFLVSADQASCESAAPLDVPDESVLRPLRERLAWQYPFRAASEERAKTSVTQLRRRREDEEHESQTAPFLRGRAFAIPSKPGTSLNAADVGAAHHVFLEHVDLRLEPTLDSLRREADRLLEARLLTTEQRKALDLDSLAAFWNSDVGRKIRSTDESKVRRELPFTARLSPGALRAMGLPVSIGLEEDEWVVVQGVVDLAVILPGEIWLLDFKTDDLSVSALAAKAEQYRPQLQLYARALTQIYGRPVSECWLHFLKLRRTISVEPGLAVSFDRRNQS